MIEKTNRTSFIRDLATRAAHDPIVERAIMGALRLVLPSVIEGLLVAEYAGEMIKIRVRKSNREQRAARDARILAAIRAGEAVASIAARERMSEFGVRKAIKRLGRIAATPVP